MVQNGYELDEIHDVRIINKSTGDLLIQSSSGLWVNSKTLVGQYTIDGGVTGSLYGTSSWALNSITSSFAATASYVNTLYQDVIVSGSLTSTSITSSNILLRSLDTSSNPTIVFSGSLTSSIRLEVAQNGSVSFIGSNGVLLDIADSLSGSLFAVNDISGFPILEVFSDNKVVMGAYNKNVLVVTGSNIGIGKSDPNLSYILDVSGSVAITGSLNVSSGITGSLHGTSSYALTASYIDGGFY